MSAATSCRQPPAATGSEPCIQCKQINTYVESAAISNRQGALHSAQSRVYLVRHAKTDYALPTTEYCCYRSSPGLWHLRLSHTPMQHRNTVSIAHQQLPCLLNFPYQPSTAHQRPQHHTPLRHQHSKTIAPPTSSCLALSTSRTSARTTRP